MKMFPTRSFRTLAFASAFVAGLVLPTLETWAETVKLHGSTTAKAALVEPNKAKIEADSGMTLEIVANGSGKGLLDLVAGRADMAMLSAPLAEVAEKLNAKAPNSVSTDGLKAFEVGKSAVAFITHPSNKVTTLTLTQLKDILAGKTTNWKDVGGADESIVVIVAYPGDGVRTVAEEKVMGKDTITKDARTMNVANQIPNAVAQLPGAIGITGTASVSEKVKALKTDKDVSVTLYFVTKSDPTPAADKVIKATQGCSK